MWPVFLLLCALPIDPDAVDTDDDLTPDPVESETVVELPADAGNLYSNDLTDAELERRFVEDLPSLGSISVGLAEAGRVINAVQVQPAPHIEVVAPEQAWGTKETVDYLNAVAEDVAAQVPDAPALRVNHIGNKEGGYLRPHFSHQSGRDVDLGFYLQAGVDPRQLKGSRLQSMNMAANWALVVALASKADVQLVLLDRSVQNALYEYGKAHGADPLLLEGLFRSGKQSLFQHARRHKDHFHVRFYSGRSQELGRRVQPLLAKRPDENLAVHRIRAGDTLGHIAIRYGSTVKLIQRANRLGNNLLRIGRTLTVPLRGPCTMCPVTPAVVVPARLFDVAREAATKAAAPSTSD